MDVDIASAVAMILGGGGTGAAGLIGLQKLGLLKNGNGTSKEITKITMTLESMVRTLEPLAGILNEMKSQLGIISDKQTSVAKIPVMDEKLETIKEALARIEDDLRSSRPTG